MFWIYLRTTIPPVESFHNLIYQQAHKCRQKMASGTGFDFDDLIAEGNLVYCLARDKFDPSKGCKFITLFNILLWQHFARLLNRSYKKRWFQEKEDMTSQIDCVEDISFPTINSHLNDQFFERLTRSASVFIRELLYGSDGYRQWEREQYKNQTYRAKHKMGRVARYLGLSLEERFCIERELREKLVVA